MRKSEWVFGLSYLCVLTALLVFGHWSRIGADPRCAYGGCKIEPLHRVRVVDADQAEFEFCCIRCAEQWLARQTAAARAIYVTDETCGAEVDAAKASFVRSPVVTNRTTGNRVHAFRHPADAQSHAQTFGGVVLEDQERPFLERR